MAFITKIPVSDETVKLMESFGFHQVTATSPHIAWRTLRGIHIIHLQDQIPRNIDDVLNLVFFCGYNTGATKQVEALKNSVNMLVTDFFESKSVTREPRRVDSLIINLPI